MRRVAVAILVATLAPLLLAGCGDGTGTPGSDERSTRQERDDATGSEEQDRSGEATDTNPDAEATEGEPQAQLPPIQVTSPKAFENVHGSLLLAGTAQVHEGALAWAILDAQLRPMARGRMSATCGAPCRGRFRTSVPLRRVPPGSWELHVWSPNTADDGPRRLHDTMVPISVTDRPVDAPAPDAPPPGGVPG